MRYLAAIATLILLALWTPFSPAQDKPANEKQKIEALIKHVEGLKDAKFVRNDTEYDAGTAATFLRRKWKSNEAEIKTAKDFIDKAASVSSTSAKPYMIRFKDKKEMKSGEYLHAELKKLEKSSSDKGQGVIGSQDVISSWSNVSYSAKQLRHDDIEMRRQAARHLATLGGFFRMNVEEAQPALIASLEDKDSQVRISSIYALMYSGPKAKAATPRMIRLLADASAEVRRACARFLAYHPSEDKQAYAALKKALNDDDPCVRIRSAWAMLAVNPREAAAMTVLAEGLKAADSETRQEVAYAFGEIGLSGLSVLRIALKDKNPNARLAATHAMSRVALHLGVNNRHEFPDDAIQSLIELLKHEHKETVYSAVCVLGVIGEPAKAAVPRITELLHDPDWSVRWIAASELRAFGSSAKAAIPALTQALEDHDQRVRRAAKETLQSLTR